MQGIYSQFTWSSQSFTSRLSTKHIDKLDPDWHYLYKEDTQELRQFTVYTTEYCFELQSLVSWYRIQEGSTVMDTSRSENNFVSRIGHVPLVNRFDLLVSYSTDYEYYNLTDTLRRTTVPGKIWFLEFSQL